MYVCVCERDSVCECECVRERDSTCEHVPGGQWDGLWEEAV